MAEKRKVSRGVKRTQRRIGALDMLQTQLKSGLKTEKGRTDGHRIPLTDKDKTRIEKEIGILKERV
jgi:hypothetical protein